MKIFLIVIGVLAVLLACGIIWMGMPRGPSLEEVAHLRSPRIVEMGPQKVLLVRAKGSPNEVGPEAFGLLMRTYFSLQGVPKRGPDFKPPRARWPVDVETPQEEWEGLYGMPIPESITAIEENTSKSGLSVELATWDYGEVAEILHVGRYDEEPPTIEALMEFIADQGYVVTGLHEEDYLKGPGFLFAGNPDNYLTIIRYPVRKVESTGGEGVG
jgi:hypothetical protein